MEENQNTLLQAWTPFVLSSIIPQELKHHTVYQNQEPKQCGKHFFLLHDKRPQYALNLNPTASFNSMKTTLINNTAQSIQLIILKLKSYSDFWNFNIIVIDHEFRYKIVKAGDSRVDLQITLTKFWRISLSITGQTREKLTSSWFFAITDYQISCPLSLVAASHKLSIRVSIKISQWVIDKSYNWSLSHYITVVKILRKTLIAIWQKLCQNYSRQELYIY